MKKLIITSVLALLTTVWSIAGVQRWPDEYLGLPGDNLNLYAVMKLFQDSETLEVFERGLNDENSRINNLDLNGDNMVDYIMVNDYVEGNVHTIVLRVALDRSETQDLAVFIVERFRNGSVQIQLIGDEALYGKNYIVEPIYDDNYGETPNPGYTGGTKVAVVRTTTYEVAGWPLVRYIFLPDYMVWRSRWYWGYWPAYWYSWRPYYWHYYYGYHSHWYPHYYRHFRIWHKPRFAHYHNFYYGGIRNHSPKVLARINEGKYRATYSRPEQRKRGEALYTRLHSDQHTVSRTNNTVQRSERRSPSQSVSTRGQAPAVTRSRTERGSSSSVRNHSGVNKSAEPNTGSSRRSTPAVTDRTGSKSAAGLNNSRRSSATVSERNFNQPSSGKSASTSGRPAVKAPVRINNKPSTVQSGTTSRRHETVSSERNVYRPSSPQTGTASRRQTQVSSEKVASRLAPAQVRSSSHRSATVSSGRVTARFATSSGRKGNAASRIQANTGSGKSDSGRTARR